jgi:hypothetical protein
MIELTEPLRPGAFILSMDDDGNLSRDNITILSGQGKLVAGQVLGSVFSAATAASAVKASGANTGNGTLTLDATTPVLAGAKAGVYTVRMTAATTYEVRDPSGVVLGEAATAATFADRLKFVVAAGGTAFVAGDGFDITVSALASKYVAYDETATTGGQFAVGVLFGGVDATSADASAVMVARHAEVNASMLVFKAGSTAAGQAVALAALKALTVVAR